MASLRDHRAALVTVAVTVTLDVAAAAVFARIEHIPFLPSASAGGGLYWAVTTMMTVGFGDVVPHHRASWWLAMGVMVSVIPLGAATISLFTSRLTEKHVRHHAAKTMAHVTRELSVLCDTKQGDGNAI